MTPETYTPTAVPATAPATAAPAPSASIESLARGLRLMDVLWEHAAHGLLPSEVATAARESASYVTRCLQTLEATGWVERIATTGRWRPSARAVRRLGAVSRALTGAEAQLAEYRNRCGTHL